MCAICGCSTDTWEHHHAHGIDHPHPHAGERHAHGPPVELRGDPPRSIVSLEADVLAKNNDHAERNRRWFEARDICALNLVSSPGAGKTTLLERTIREVGRELAIHVIEGDQATDRDAARIRGAGARAVQVNTGAGCHLDAAMVARALEELGPPRGALLAIENVGNLVCPALFDLGERLKVVVASVTEGDDKPIKYPHMFRASDVMILNKIDLLPHVDFDVDRCIELARKANPAMVVFRVSATRGDGLGALHAWLREQMAGRPSA
jgi:hydrogenase nickel incorporation protein HypB